MASEAMDQVLPLWTEVMAEMIEEVVSVSVWGRTYDIASAPLPTSITTGGEEVLSSPIRLVGTLDKMPMSWERKGAFLFRKNKTQATISGWQANSSLIVNTTLQVEFDGLMRVDMAIMPQRGISPKLEELWLEVPLKADRSTLFHYWPGRWGTAANSGATPEEGLAMPFKPFVWLGWEEGGLSWFTESDKGWQPKDANRYIEVVRQGEETLLRLHILDSEPERFPLTLTFGFQATPVKPVPRDFHEWRICHGASYGIEKRPVEEGKTVLDRMTELGVKTLVFHEHWTPIQNYWETTHKAELRQLVTECHKRGIKLLLYFGYELSTLAPEWGRLSDQVLVKNAQGGLAGGYHRQPEQRDYILSIGTPGQAAACDAITGESLTLEGKCLRLTLPPMRARLVRVE